MSNSNKSTTIQVIGIDPGLSGAMSVLAYKEGVYSVLECKPLPLTETLSGKDQLDIKEFSSFLKQWPDAALIAAEQQGPRNEDRVSSVFTLGRFYGRLETCICLASLPAIFPSPQSWKKVIFTGTGVTLGKTRQEQKASAISLVKTRFPDLSLRRTKLSRTDCDGMAESVCLALYALRYLHMTTTTTTTS